MNLSLEPAWLFNYSADKSMGNYFPSKKLVTTEEFSMWNKASMISFYYIIAVFRNFCSLFSAVLKFFSIL